ncbi:MAG TPA: T9SS type A sorting domain-containing protein [Chitinophagales bacterium]|nr:T9SS type A sorting domain-containing protein [Chitinophagales bacterium]
MAKQITALLIAVWLHALAFAQQTPFGVYIEPFEINNLGGLQAYAWGQHNGKWLIIGGRLDGLHRRQPFASFDVAGNNNQLLVIDPVLQQKWAAPLTSLSTDLQEQLSSTNMQFHQSGNYLYLTGGYGYNSATAARKTFAALVAVDVPAVINAVLNGTPLTAHFRQINDEQFAVTGGHLKKSDGVYYLLGGNRFDGNYNPMGHATYTQAYTNAIRRFILTDDGTTITVNHLLPYTDSVNLHRRDYNAVQQIMPDGSEGFTMFSGVFQPTADLPFLNCVNVDSTGYTVNNNFQQYYNHYHCAVLPVYAAGANQMHSVFFGGIAQYYDSAGVLVQDNNVPFVKTIARVTRTADSTMAEYKLPVEMPGYLGAGAEFIPLHTTPMYSNEVIKLDSLTADTNLVGYIYGGISSTAPNVFFTNTGTESSASNRLYKVYVIKDNTTGLHQLNRQSNGSLKMQVYPNPASNNFTVGFNLTYAAPTTITVHSTGGDLLLQTTLPNTTTGENYYSVTLDNEHSTGTYIVTIQTPYEKATQKIITTY